MKSLFQKIRSQKASKITFFVVSDAVIIVLSWWAAFALRFDGNIPVLYAPAIFGISLLSLAVIIPVFYHKNLYSFSWAYVSDQELVSLAKGLVIGFFFIALVVFLPLGIGVFSGFPRSVFLVSFLLVFLWCGALRLSKRIYIRLSGGKANIKKDRTLIIGSGDSGEQIVRSILSSKKSAYYPVGFIDENKSKQGVLIHGVRVLGKLADLERIIQEKNIKQVIIALPSHGAGMIKNAVAQSRAAGVYKIKIIPPFAEIVQGNISFRNLKDVDIEDLLGRESIFLDDALITNWIKGKTVLVTGAAGSIGSELCRQIAVLKPSLLLLIDQDETGIFNISNQLQGAFPGQTVEPLVADIRDSQKMGEVFSRWHIDMVFHAAAYKHVPLMENNIDEAVKNNILGTDVLARASVAAGVEKFIFISTDKAVNPTSVMGATKRFGEMVCNNYNKQGATKFISVRFGNVLNSRGSVIPIFREQIRRGGPVQVTDPRMKRYFMLISEACLLVMQSGAMGSGGEVFVLDMGKPVNILDLAREMITLSGFTPDKDIAITFTGIRPGEKLFEEILTAEEGVVATQNKKIFMAKLSEIPAEKFLADKEKLEHCLRQNNTGELLKLLKSIVPFYQ